MPKKSKKLTILDYGQVAGLGLMVFVGQMIKYIHSTSFDLNFSPEELETEIEVEGNFGQGNQFNVTDFDQTRTNGIEIDQSFGIDLFSYFNSTTLTIASIFTVFMVVISLCADRQRSTSKGKGLEEGLINQDISLQKQGQSKAKTKEQIEEDRINKLFKISDSEDEITFTKQYNLSGIEHNEPEQDCDNSFALILNPKEIIVNGLVNKSRSTIREEDSEDI